MTYDARYAKQWHYARSKGVLQWQPVDEARSRITSLLDQGFSGESIAKAAGISASAVRGISGRYAPTKNISRRIARRIVALTPTGVLATLDEPTMLVPAVGAQRRVQALQAIGHKQSDIDAAAGLRPRIAKYVADRQPGVSITFDKHAAIARAYEALWSKPGSYERGRREAIARGYAPPLAWDDDTIDDPNATPDLGAETPRPQGGAGRPFAEVVEDVEDILSWEPYTTATELAHRLGYRDSSGIQIALRRGERTDLLAQLARNAEVKAA